MTDSYEWHSIPFAKTRRARRRTSRGLDFQAVCGLGPVYFLEWNEDAASLPACQRCVKRVGQPPDTASA